MEFLYLLAGVVVGVALCAVWCAMRLHGPKWTQARAQINPLNAGGGGGGPIEPP
jgi:hypothetical protein